MLREKRNCANCMKGISIPVNNDILCREKGVVSRNYVCSQHKFLPEPKSFKEMNYKCINCENFIPDISKDNNSSTMGLCQLFSVRKFDGNEKKACSKFVKKTQLEVS